jgi:CBS domain-containing protein
MNVSEAMWTDLKVVSPEHSLSAAITLMTDAHVSALPVVDAAGRLVGVLSTTDILQAEADCSGPDDRVVLFDETTAGDLMTPRPATISPHADVKEAAQQMLYLEVHRLFVVQDGRLVGVISQSDIVRAVATARI